MFYIKIYCLISMFYIKIHCFPLDLALFALGSWSALGYSSCNFHVAIVFWFNYHIVTSFFCPWLFLLWDLGVLLAILAATFMHQLCFGLITTL
jgi:hypothetical protein